MIGLSYKQKCNNFGYLSIEVWSKGNDRRHTKLGVQNVCSFCDVIHEKYLSLCNYTSAYAVPLVPVMSFMLTL